MNSQTVAQNNNAAHIVKVATTCIAVTTAHIKSGNNLNSSSCNLVVLSSLVVHSEWHTKLGVKQFTKGEPTLTYQHYSTEHRGVRCTELGSTNYNVLRQFTTLTEMITLHWWQSS